MNRITYLEAKLHRDELIREARERRLAASVKRPTPPRRWAPPAFSLRIRDLRPAI